MSLLVVLDFFLVTTPLRAVWRIGNNHINITSHTRSSSKSIAIINVGMAAETTLDSSQSIESIIVFAAPCMDALITSLRMQSVGYSKQQVCTATSRVVNMYVLVLRLCHLGSHNVRNKRNNIVRCVLFPCRRCTDVGPLTFDVFLQCGDSRVIVRRKIYLRPSRNDRQQNLLTAQFSDIVVHVQVLLFILSTFYTQ